MKYEDLILKLPQESSTYKEDSEFVIRQMTAILVARKTVGDNKIIINTNRGEKSVTLFKDGVETNIINKVYPSPAWFILQPGDNVFMYSAENPDLLQIVFKHFTQYEGVQHGSVCTG